MKTLVNALLLAAVSCVLSAPVALADEMKIEVKTGTAMKNILTEFSGKRVAIRLESGDQLEGTVTQVGNSLVHISKLVGKEYYDAVVSIDKVSAVIVRAR